LRPWVPKAALLRDVGHGDTALLRVGYAANPAGGTTHQSTNGLCFTGGARLDVMTVLTPLDLPDQRI